jgi:prepilin-type N-terminal cleavage/methylation domain-containing protein
MVGFQIYNPKNLKTIIPLKYYVNLNLSPKMFSFKSAFTLIELLLVIGLLGLVATIVIPQFAGTKSDAIEPIIQSELTAIQRAFFRFKNDVNLQTSQYITVAQYGVSVLITNEIEKTTLFDNWDPDRQRGWRGTYINSEGEKNININLAGQPDGTIAVPVIFAPNQDNESNNTHYYRIIATDENNKVITNLPSPPLSVDIYQLWLIYPYKNINDITNIPDQNESERKYYRKLIAETD